MLGGAQDGSEIHAEHAESADLQEPAPGDSGTQEVGAGGGGEWHGGSGFVISFG